MYTTLHVCNKLCLITYMLDTQFPCRMLICSRHLSWKLVVIMRSYFVSVNLQHVQGVITITGSSMTAAAETVYHFAHATVGMRSIAMSMSVCPSTCISQKPQVQTLLNFLYVISGAMAWSFSHDSGIYYVLIAFVIGSINTGAIWTPSIS